MVPKNISFCQILGLFWPIHCWTNIVSTLLLLGIRSLNVLLAHSIAVNTSHRSFGYYKPGHTSPHCIRFSVIRRKWEKLTFSFYSLVGSVLIQSYQSEYSHNSVLIDWHVLYILSRTMCAWSFPGFKSIRFKGKLEELTGTSNTLMWSRCFHNWDHH
jgi:hypothetical protein